MPRPRSEAATARTTAVLPETPPLPAATRAGATRGRPAGRHPDETRERILNAAEALFADNGFHGTSMRDVARAVAVQTAAVSYHYASKDDLFDSVVGRRATVMTAYRQTELDALRKAYGQRPVPLDRLVRTYVQPFVESASHGDPGWRHYAALMGRLANSPLGTEVIARHYDATARAYLREFTRSLPGVAEATVVNGFTFMVASMLALCSDTGRARRLLRRAPAGDAHEGHDGQLGHDGHDGHNAHDGQLHAAFEHLVGFLVAGFLALPAGMPARRRRAAAPARA